MTVPELLVGAWQRESISIDGATPYEDADVIWLQTPNRYADIRVPQSGSGQCEAFGGRQDWADPTLVFHHEIDLCGGFAEDRGVLSFDGDVMIEDGQVDVGDRTVRYRERWRRITRQSPDYCAFEQRHADAGLLALLVVVCDYMMIMASKVPGATLYGPASDAPWLHVEREILLPASPRLDDPASDWVFVEGRLAG